MSLSGTGSTLQMPLHYPQPECQGDVVDIDQVRFIFGERFKFKWDLALMKQLTASLSIK